MLLKSNSSIEPSSDASSAALARPKRYERRRSGLTRSSQSTVIAPGEAKFLTSVPSGVPRQWRLLAAFTNATQPESRRNLAVTRRGLGWKPRHEQSRRRLGAGAAVPDDGAGVRHHGRPAATGAPRPGAEPAPPR